VLPDATVAGSYNFRVKIIDCSNLPINSVTASGDNFNPVYTVGNIALESVFPVFTVMEPQCPLEYSIIDSVGNVLISDPVFSLT
jgi:hypothetical protein